MALFGIQIMFILIEKDLINMEEDMMKMVNIFPEKDGMKKIIVMKVKKMMIWMIMMMKMKKHIIKILILNMIISTI